MKSITRHYNRRRARRFVGRPTVRGATVSDPVDTFRGADGIPRAPRPFALLNLVCPVSDCAGRLSPPGGRASAAVSPPRWVFALCPVAPPAKLPGKTEKLSSLAPPRCIGQVRARVQRRQPSISQPFHGGSVRTWLMSASVLLAYPAIAASTAFCAAAPRLAKSSNTPTAPAILDPRGASRVI